MDDSIRQALAQGGVIDITTTGSRSGEPRRIEIVFHVIGGRIYISGMPNAQRKRSWLANLEADPRFTFHLERGSPPISRRLHASFLTKGSGGRSWLMSPAAPLRQK